MITLTHDLTKSINDDILHVPDTVMAGDEPDSKKARPVLDPATMSSKQYLDSLVVPHLLPALNAVSTNRPQDPIQYLVS